ncbi:nucleolar and spindle-associated protein 1 [Gadus macrocephalus]|uniref:nucleolar and spindle-associated protein 1 n=1 Tax=Gadus macrocephalus TaxID=80720 RepID=UPI0028CB3E9B|nr:nucleolar and spindle-associated protein 1 [Gadus macrocephalus]
MDLDAMKYPKLRSLAKELGLKSNMKADRLRITIKQHYEQEQQLKEDQVMDSVDLGAQEDVNANLASVGDDPSTKKSLFVTSRRGKTSKRKISDGEQPLVTAEVEPETGVLDEGGIAKKRRVSATTKPEETGPVSEQQAEVQPDPAACDQGTGNDPKLEVAGRIPRHAGLMKRNKPLMKASTPNFKKLHEAHFNRMESIDSYVQRKTKQETALKAASQDLKVPPKSALPKPADVKPQQLVKLSRSSLMSPAVPKPTAAQDEPRARRAVQREASFRPSVLSLRRINVQFSEATLDNKSKKSQLKTPTRLSTCVARRASGRPTGDKPSVTKSSNASASKTPGAFVFSGNTSSSVTPGNNKPSFDLKASLSKPLSYKPHTGKLKPFGDAKENAAANTTVVQLHQKNYKQHQVQTREERRTKQTQGRKQKKESALGARRGLVMS